MTFQKKIDSISYEDIEALVNNQINESDIIEYKSQLIPDQDLLKQVCAFANTRGEDLIFGVTESGKGGHPTKILGLEEKSVNKERLEQVIIFNIVPRLNVQIRTIKIKNSEKIILIIRIPNSYQKPHQNNKDGKFYKRFQFESTAMTEDEVSNHYQNRFRNSEQLEQYIKNTLEDRKEDAIITNIIVIPTSIKDRLIETIDYEDLKWRSDISTKPSIQEITSSTLIPNILTPFAHGVTSRSISKAYAKLDNERFQELNIHRNGCIHRIESFINKDNDRISFPYVRFAIRLMQMLQFSNVILQHYNYFGDVRIYASVSSSSRLTRISHKWVKIRWFLQGQIYHIS